MSRPPRERREKGGVAGERGAPPLASQDGAIGTTLAGPSKKEWENQELPDTKVFYRPTAVRGSLSLLMKKGEGSRIKRIWNSPLNTNALGTKDRFQKPGFETGCWVVTL